MLAPRAEREQWCKWRESGGFVPGRVSRRENRVWLGLILFLNTERVFMLRSLGAFCIMCSHNRTHRLPSPVISFSTGSTAQWPVNRAAGAGYGYQKELWDGGPRKGVVDLTRVDNNHLEDSRTLEQKCSLNLLLIQFPSSLATTPISGVHIDPPFFPLTF